MAGLDGGPEAAVVAVVLGLPLNLIAGVKADDTTAVRLSRPAGRRPSPDGYITPLYAYEVPRLDHHTARRRRVFAGGRRTVVIALRLDQNTGVPVKAADQAGL